ncbi:predicted protein [Naegleria gruberi]|uniref:Predicted protein n=1 Tax=Naegleria gruberi TaxID=5762 RepID=D2VXK4_NAEGR|nr:uncharacterized protein NAEGRDRAFT_73780 [Naegleria gruberi]EFC38524.1 predicted protein [Naegleria gruberi]|eukprot:XP_002671268.1 predicted protein [Naegleria gruberi strain NEG-M]
MKRYCSVIVGLVLMMAFAASVANATLGLDLSYFQGDVSQSSWNCLKQSGREFAIIQAQLSTGRVNPYVANDINRAKAAGIKYVDIYIFPNINEDAAAQVQNTVNFIKSNGATFGQIWLDIEGPQYWTNNCQTNVNFISRMVNAGRATGYPVHIYSSHSQWQPITCGSTAFSNLQLWWAYYDNNASFDNFQSFGGWR